MRLLVAEYDPSTDAYLKKGPIEHGHLVDLATNGKDGLYLAAAGAYVKVAGDALPGITIDYFLLIAMTMSRHL